jgi:hypothetical protein
VVPDYSPGSSWVYKILWTDAVIFQINGKIKLLLFNRVIKPTLSDTSRQHNIQE